MGHHWNDDYTADYSGKMLISKGSPNLSHTQLIITGRPLDRHCPQ